MSASSSAAYDPSIEDEDHTSKSKWDQTFERLLQYRSKHGHCLVPNRYPEDPSLGSWVSTQRRQYKLYMAKETSNMTEERIRRLEEIGFVWSTVDPRHVPWEDRYNELKQFVAEYGHAQVPIGWPKNVPLSNWVSTQRQEYRLLKKGRRSRLTPERIAKLEALDFAWVGQRGFNSRKRPFVEEDHQTARDDGSNQKRKWTFGDNTVHPWMYPGTPYHSSSERAAAAHGMVLLRENREGRRESVASQGAPFFPHPPGYPPGPNGVAPFSGNQSRYPSSLAALGYGMGLYPYPSKTAGTHKFVATDYGENARPSMARSRRGGRKGA